MDVKVVIGSNFGDEGKGLMTDYFCHQSETTPIVVLHNGGAQRGHTVVTPEGKRHVFHHFSAGTFTDAHTYFAESFIVNPMEFIRESEELEFTPTIYIHPLCRITTPYDMIANILINEKTQHGSCGMGINETIVRNLVWNYTYKSMCDMSMDKNLDYLTQIRDYYKTRLLSFGVNEIPREWKDVWYSDDLLLHFLCDCNKMKDKVIPSQPYLLSDYDTVIFEGAQGLLLDKDNTEYYPHLTPSNTGLQNPYHMIETYIPGSDVEVCYVTRTYMTRHGAGRFDTECPKELINPDMHDKTNEPNPYQGALRYGTMDMFGLKQRILKDMEGAPHYKMSIAITHFDESNLTCTEEEFRDFIYGFSTLYTAHGETRNDVTRNEMIRNSKT